MEPIESSVVDSAVDSFLFRRDVSVRSRVEGASRCRIELTTEQQYTLHGTASAIERAKKYIGLFRLHLQSGVVFLFEEDEHEREDLTLLRIPPDAFEKSAQSIISLELGFKVVLFNAIVCPPEIRAQYELILNHSDHTPEEVVFLKESKTKFLHLACFGAIEKRIGAVLRAMFLIESLSPSYYTRFITNNVEICPDEIGIDTVLLIDASVDPFIVEEAKKLCTNRSLCFASHCFVELISNVVFFGGSTEERLRARNYLKWRMHGITSEDYLEAILSPFCEVFSVPSNFVQYLVEDKLSRFRSIEDRSYALLFPYKIDENSYKILVCSYHKKSRDRAANSLRKHISFHGRLLEHLKDKEKRSSRRKEVSKKKSRKRSFSPRHRRRRSTSSSHSSSSSDRSSSRERFSRRSRSLSRQSKERR